LAGELKFLKKSVDAPELWDRIEAGLRQEQKARMGRQADSRAYGLRGVFGLKRLRLIPALAVLIVGIGIGIYVGLKLAEPPSGLLAGAALRKIELKGREYIQAIEELESKARTRMASMDINLLSLYRTKLETIDAQIERCREALDGNPGNAHIRRYMLTALEDKRQTLVEVLSYRHEI
jgi:hypothetical protein